MNSALFTAFLLGSLLLANGQDDSGKDESSNYENDENLDEKVNGALQVINNASDCMSDCEKEGCYDNCVQKCVQQGKSLPMEVSESRLEQSCRQIKKIRKIANKLKDKRNNN